MLYQRTIVTLAVALLTIAGTSYSMAGPPRGNGGGSGGSGPITDNEIEDLVFMWEEEKLARDSYIVLGEEWGLAIFSNIAKSEQKHMDALEKLIDKSGLTDPVDDESAEGIGDFKNDYLEGLYAKLIDWGLISEMDSLKVGGAIEETDIRDIHHAIERAKNQNIITTYESLLCGSRNHLRAFVAKIQIDGVVYEPFLEYPDPDPEYSDPDELDELWEIIRSPMEQDCGGNRRGRQGSGGNRQDK